MIATRPRQLPFTGDPEADALLATEPMALLIGFVLDQQVTVQKAFAGPLELLRRIGTLDAVAVAARANGSRGISKGASQAAPGGCRLVMEVLTSHGRTPQPAGPEESEHHGLTEVLGAAADCGWIPGDEQPSDRAPSGQHII